MELFRNTQHILQENERHKTIRDGNIVKKSALSEQAQQSLAREKKYTESFHIGSRDSHAKLPEITVTKDSYGNIKILQMPYYPGEAMQELKAWSETNDQEEMDQLFDEIIHLTGILRTKYHDSVGKLKSDTIKRFGKYSLALIKSGVQGKVASLIGTSKQETSFEDTIYALQVAWSTFFHFEHFSEEYQIHGCLHLEHIRRDTDRKLVPIDFEHGANFPRRLKYQDEAYIFQNILQHIDDEAVAQAFLEKWFTSIEYAENATERDHADIALCEKLLGGIHEELRKHSEKSPSIVKKHIEYLLHFGKTGSFGKNDLHSNPR